MYEMNILLQDMSSFACRSLVETVKIAGSAYIFVHEKQFFIIKKPDSIFAVRFVVEDGGLEPSTSAM